MAYGSPLLGMGANMPPRTDAGRFHRSYDELFAAWSVATAEANIAYDAWQRDPGAGAYTAFLAADDRAGAAQDALAARVT